MASIINSTDTGSGGLITTGDSSDELQLQTAETTAVTITSGQQSAFIAGTASAPAVTTTGDLNTGIYFPAADNIGFATNGVIRGRWTTDGLCFGSDTAAANALDDYEEGTWTPAYTASSSNPTVTYNLQDGIYTKIGDTVFVSCEINATSSTGGSGDLRVAGLPFNVNNSNAGRSAGFSNNYSDGFSSTTTPTSLLAEANTTYVVCRTNATSDSRSNRSTTVDVSAIASGGRLFLSMTYKAA